jgi:membrane protease subunit (stomatin/prohibitin family)
MKVMCPMRNPNETAFVGGRKHWTDIIKNSGPSNLLVWRQPEEDFNDNSTLIVMPSEQAIFYKDGRVHQVFDEGKYTLGTENYPFVSRFHMMLQGGISAFNCVVYFVRKADSPEILWGTQSRIQLRDPVQGIATSISAHGAYKVSIADGAKLITTLLGNSSEILTHDDLVLYFRNTFQQRIKEQIAKAILELNEEILGVVTRQTEIAQRVQALLADVMKPYGISLVDFSIASIELPEDDPNRQLIEDNYAKRRVKAVLGDMWGTQQGVDILKAFVSNPAGGGPALGAAGAHMGLSEFGPALGGISQPLLALILNDMQKDVNTSPQPPAPNNRFQQRNTSVSMQETQNCPACKTENTKDSNFCKKCGSPLTPIQKKCPFCDAEIPDDATFCSKCGKKIE